MWHRCEGIVIYDPWRADMQRRTNNWCVIQIDREITRYYREWLRTEKHIHLQPPSWDAHVSVIRGERLTETQRTGWKKYHKQRVVVEYKHIGEYDTTASGLRDDLGLYYIVEARCDMVTQIRQEMGLPTNWPPHLTFGRVHDYVARRPKRLP